MCFVLFIKLFISWAWCVQTMAGAEIRDCRGAEDPSAFSESNKVLFELYMPKPNPGTLG